MANQKAELHNIQLKTSDICLNKYNHDIKPYGGFRKNNSPFYGNVLSPFYSKVHEGIGNESYVTEDGEIYSIKDGSLYLIKGNNELKLNDTTDTKYITKDDLEVSDNENYPTILAFFQISADHYDMLCVSEEGIYAIIKDDGTTRYSFTSGAERYYPNEIVHFAEYNNGAYCFGIAKNIYFIDNTLHNLHTESLAPGVANRVTDIKMSCVNQNINNTDGFIACIYAGEIDQTYIYNVAGTSITSVGSIVVTNVPDGQNHTYTGSQWKLFFNREGETVFTAKSYRYTYNNNNFILQFGSNVRFNGSNSIYITYAGPVASSTSEGTAYDLLDRTFDNNISTAVIGSAFGATMHYPAQNIEHRWTQIVPTKFLGWTVSVSTKTWTTIETKPAWNELVTDGYCPYLYNTDNKKIYRGVPINNDKSYMGGLVSNLSNNVRALYNNGGILTGISLAQDDTTIGTLLCGMTEISGEYPIGIYSYDGITFISYHDNQKWVRIKVDPAKSKASMKVLNNEYILLNIDGYYNCFGIKDKRWHHYGSDWNDRMVVTSFSYRTDISTWASYINNAEQYYFASAIAAGYTALDTSFISTLFPSYAAMLSKDLASNGIGVEILNGGSPNNQDIDIYYDKTADYGAAPRYRYSLDFSSIGTYSGKHKYINSKLSNTVYNSDFTLIPSIFAEFINGFINQGIIIDNGHTYMQHFVNNIRPLYAINFVSQLEGTTNAFIIQGQSFVIINRSIYLYNNGIASAVVNIDNMKLIGYNPYMALFWSATNRTFYKFTGDNILYPIIQADEISEIIDTSYNPNTLSIYIVTDTCILIVAQDYMVKLQETGYNKVFPLKSGVIFTSIGKSLELSYNPIDGYEVKPIELETELYGYGNSVKAVNDTVYLRLYCQDKKTGKVKISSETLNETSRIAESKEFNITESMWDKESNTIFIRYQPENQAATGFSVHITSPFAIATLQVASTPETVQNSKYNM
jgi:hypothetical protein